MDILTHLAPNRAALRDALAECCARHLRTTGGAGTTKWSAARHVTFDVDSFPIQVHGHQPGAAYNGYYQETVYHPLVASRYDSMHEGHRLGNGFVHAILRQGQVHTAQGVLRLAEPLAYRIDLRLDAGSAAFR